MCMSTNDECMYICMYVQVHVCMYVYVRAYIRAYVCMYIYSAKIKKYPGNSFHA